MKPWHPPSPIRQQCARAGLAGARAAIVAAVLLAPVTAGAARPAACPAGRFVVVGGDPLLAPETASAAPAAVELDATGGAVVAGCAFDAVRIKARKNASLVRAHARSCGALRAVTLVARIVAPGCTSMSGVLRARRVPRREFVATRSTCGDGLRDPGVEACDGDDGCDAGEHCSDACTCTADVATTTTTIGVQPATTSTTAVLPVGTTTTIAGTPTTTTASTSTTSTTGAATTSTTVTLPGGTCFIENPPHEGASHRPVGTPLTFEHNPPASGNHFDTWAAYHAYTIPLARGYWVHNLEHGAIVFVYRPDAPAAVVQALRAVYDGLPNDPMCGHTRAILTPDPLLDQPFAVVAWQYVLNCDVVDPPGILSFVLARRGHSSENNCAQGVEP